MGPAGIEPTTFTRNRSFFCLYGFLLAPEFRHPRVWSANPLLISGALNGWHRLPVRLSSSLSSVQSKDRTWLDYGPSQQHSASSKYIRFLNNKRNLKKARVWMIRRLPAIGCGTHLIPFRTQKLNHAPFSVLVWSSAT